MIVDIDAEFVSQDALGTPMLRIAYDGGLKYHCNTRYVS
jgi:hypothetical protein